MLPQGNTLSTTVSPHIYPQTRPPPQHQSQHIGPNLPEEDTNEEAVNFFAGMPYQETIRNNRKAYATGEGGPFPIAQVRGRRSIVEETSLWKESTWQVKAQHHNGATATRYHPTATEPVQQPHNLKAALCPRLPPPRRSRSGGPRPIQR
jgi:hypothetical protein